MKALIVGGGKGCSALLDLAQSTFLQELRLEVLGVVDVNYEAPGMVYARRLGIPTFTKLEEAIFNPELELVIELTGNDEFLRELYKIIPPGIKLIDHTFAHIFWDLVNAKDFQKRQLEELQNLEKKIEKESIFLQCLFDSHPDLAIVVDLNNVIIKANAKFYEYTNFSPDEVIGKKCKEVLKKVNLCFDEDNFTCDFQKIIETKKSITIYKSLDQPKETHWEITRSPILNKNGEVEAILGIWHRVTDEVILQREIEISERKFKSFIDSADDWISIKDIEGKYIIVNEKTAKAFKMKPEDFVGKKPEDILSQKVANIIKMHDNEVIQSRSAKKFTEVIQIDGVDHHFQTVRFPLFDHLGNITAICTIDRDITNEIRLKDKLVQSEKLAALGKLAAGVAHEINNPLTGILAYAEDILDELPEDSLLKEDIRVIIRETLRCRDIVRNLLDFAKQDIPKLEVLNINNIVEGVLQLVHRLPQFKDIYFDVRLIPSNVNIQGDMKQIQQVLLNLMLNAADAMKYKGKITISTGFEKGKEKAIISISDTGPGIPENLMDKIFEPFFSTKGTSGLGLAVSWGIIERHNGTIEVDTTEEGGATFRILLPIYKSSQK